MQQDVDREAGPPHEDSRDTPSILTTDLLQVSLLSRGLVWEEDMYACLAQTATEEVR